MKACPWEEIRGFQSPGEFNRFVGWITEQAKLGTVEEVPISSPYAGATFQEKWFRHKESGKVWRLVWPDAPFTGVFELVD